MARLGILHEACLPFLARDSYGDWDSAWAYEFERLDEELPEQDGEYSQRRSLLESAKIHFAWRLQKCRAVPSEALRPLAALPTPPPHYDSSDWHQGHEMIRAALRLGDEWAVANMIGYNATVNSIWRLDPAAAYLHRAGIAFVESAGRELELAYVMVAMTLDTGSLQARLDWSGWSDPFLAG